MNRIKKIRKEKNLTVAELATKIGISQSMLSNYENGNSQPRDQDIWKKLAQILDVDISYLMGFSNNRPIPIEDAWLFLEENNGKNKGNSSVTILGGNSAFLTDDDITIQNIYDDLSEEKKETLFEVAQSLLAAQLLAQSIDKNISEKN